MKSSSDRDVDQRNEIVNSLPVHGSSGGGGGCNTRQAEKAQPDTGVSQAGNWRCSQDPDNPKNWPFKTRVPIAGIITTIGFLAGFASAAPVPGILFIQAQFGESNKVIGTLATSLYVLGFGVGPFVLAPLSELYGRKPIYCYTLVIFTLLQIACALSPSLPFLIVFRLLSGCFGSVAPSLGPASMSDLWAAHERGIWNSFLSVGVLSGPPMGTLVASFIVSKKSWRWIFWVIAIFAGCVLCLTLIIFEETYEPVILRKREKSSAAVSSSLSITARHDFEPPPKKAQIFWRAITRPLRFLVTSPIVVLLSLFAAYSFAMLYLILVSLPLLFGVRNPTSSNGLNNDSDQDQDTLFNYNFHTTIQTGLSYLGLVVGFLFAGMFQMQAQTRIYRTLSAKNEDGQGRPEYRLLPMTVSVIFFPVGLLWYGWSAESEKPWILPEIGLALFSFGVFVNFQSVQIYLAEAFIPYSASAIAAATLMRCVCGAVFPLFGQAMFLRLGYGWACTVLALLAVPAIPIPWMFYKIGERLREKYKFKA